MRHHARIKKQAAWFVLKLLLIPVILLVVTCGKKAPPIPPVPIVPGPPAEDKVIQTGDLFIYAFRLPLMGTDNKPTEVTRVQIYRLKDQRIAPQTQPQTQSQPQTQTQPQTQSRPQTQSAPQTQPQTQTQPAQREEQPRSIPDVEFKERSELIADIPQNQIEAYIRDGLFLITDKFNAVADSPDFMNWFHYAVSLTNKKGKTSPISKSVATFPAIVPKAPTNFSASLSEQKITLKWAPVTEDILGKPLADRKIQYNIYRGTSADFAPLSPVNSSPIQETTYEDSTAQFGQSYYYLVRAQFIGQRKEQESTGSNAVLVFPQDIYPPKAPEELNVVSAREGMVLIWAPNPEPDVAGYNIYRTTESGKGYTRVNRELVYETTFTDTAIEPETTYYYVVTAVDNAPNPNESKYSNEVSEVKRNP